jgi:hypothetical protein
LLAEYKTSKEIAVESASAPAPRNHCANICVKLTAGSHALVKFAIEHKSELA